MSTISDAELFAALTEIDAKLRRENVNISAWPLCGLSELSIRLQTAIEVPGELSGRIFRWFDRVYGSRLQMGLSLGTTAILIGGDIYKVTLPMIFGTSVHVLESGPVSRFTTLGGQQVGLANIGQNIEGLTPARVEMMTSGERNAVVDIFGNAMVSGSDIYSVTYSEFIREGKADLATSVEYLLTKPAQFGLSRWASLQAVEKFLKASIHERGGLPERIHALEKLAEAAERLGLKTVNRTALQAVQCSAGVRYGSEPSTLSQAMDAHRAATEICGSIAAQFKARDEWRIARYDGKSTDSLRHMVLLMPGKQEDFDRAQSASNDVAK